LTQYNQRAKTSLPTPAKVTYACISFKNNRIIIFIYILFFISDVGTIIATCSRVYQWSCSKLVYWMLFISKSKDLNYHHNLDKKNWSVFKKKTIFTFWLISTKIVVCNLMLLYTHSHTSYFIFFLNGIPVQWNVLIIIYW
jgi:hypothetical protein